MPKVRKINRDEVVKMFISGKSPLIIAYELDCHRTTIYNILKSKGIMASLSTGKKRNYRQGHDGKVQVQLSDGAFVWTTPEKAEAFYNRENSEQGKMDRYLVAREEFHHQMVAGESFGRAKKPRLNI